VAAACWNQPNFLTHQELSLVPDPSTVMDPGLSRQACKHWRIWRWLWPTSFPIASSHLGNHPIYGEFGFACTEYIYIYHYLADIFFVKFLLYMTTTIDQQVTWTWAGQYFYTDVVIFQRIASHTWVPTFDQHPDCAKDPMIIKMLLTSTDMISQLLSIFWPRPTISTPDEWTRYYVSLIGSEGTCRHYYLRFKMVIILLLKSPFHSSEVSIFAAEIPMSSPIHPLITYRFPITLLLEKVTSQFAQKNALPRLFPGELASKVDRWSFSTAWGGLWSLPACRDADFAPAPPWISGHRTWRRPIWWNELRRFSVDGVMVVENDVGELRKMGQNNDLSSGKLT
jgi:hypothetical protein